MHRSQKPVRKCHGCDLNCRERCGIFDDPRLMWQRHKACPGYRNAALYEQYLARLACPENPRKLKRRIIARQRRATMRQNGDRHVLIAAVQR